LKPVLGAAVPLLGRLRRPALGLPTRLQVVVKAQRIILPPGENSEYHGLWHSDGDKDRVIAVVLYYYHIDKELEGGDLEFLGKEPIDILGIGDCSNNLYDFDRNAQSLLRQEVRGKGNFPRGCKVPVKEGTLLVFSNYQMVHRVLKMVSKAQGREASRDFVALFILDPTTPQVPAQSHLAKRFLFERALAGPRVLPPAELEQKEEGATPSPPLGRLPRSVAQLILEFDGMIIPKPIRLATRNQLLREQLKPKGKLGTSNNRVYATGNGCYTMIGWLDSLLSDPKDNYRERHGYERVELLNCTPQTIGRGCSELMSVDSGDVDKILEKMPAWEDREEGVPDARAKEEEEEEEE
jgi:hypothetical protein